MDAPAEAFGGDGKWVLFSACSYMPNAAVTAVVREDEREEIYRRRYVQYINVKQVHRNMLVNVWYNSGRLWKMTALVLRCHFGQGYAYL